MTVRSDAFQQVSRDFPKRSAAPARHLRKVPSVVARQRKDGDTVNETPQRGAELVHIVGTRVAIYARQRYPKHTAKRLAADTGCSVETTKKWLSGKCPATKHLFQLWVQWGRDFFAFVFRPLDEDLAEIALLKAEIEEAQKILHRVNQQMGGNEDSHSKE